MGMKPPAVKLLSTVSGPCGDRVEENQDLLRGVRILFRAW
jgi:hypothetical protein